MWEQFLLWATLSQKGSCSWLLRVTYFPLWIEVIRNREKLTFKTDTSVVSMMMMICFSKKSVLTSCLVRKVGWIIHFIQELFSLENNLFMMMQNGKYFFLEPSFLFSSILSHMLRNYSLLPSLSQKESEDLVSQKGPSSREAINFSDVNAIYHCWS